MRTKYWKTFGPEKHHLSFWQNPWPFYSCLRKQHITVHFEVTLQFFKMFCRKYLKLFSTVTHVIIFWQHIGLQVHRFLGLHDKLPFNEIQQDSWGQPTITVVVVPSIWSTLYSCERDGFANHIFEDHVSYVTSYFSNRSMV